MKTSLDHLPQEKRDDLDLACGIIREEFDVDMIILFGSYARGDWVEELRPDGLYKYQSDFDILSLTDKKSAKKHGKWKRVRDHLWHVLSTRVTLIHESLGYFNQQLSDGRYFYLDVKKEGIVLYDSGKHARLHEPRPLTSEEYQRKAQDYFDYWFKSGERFVAYHETALSQENWSDAAFLLHQATERFYGALLLVLTDYKPKTHDLDDLGTLVAGRDPTLLGVFPQGTKEERDRFQLLRRAYVDARYKMDYRIAREELEWLAGRVDKLRDLTRQICTRKIESFTAPG